MSRKIIIFGAQGQVGWELQRSLCCLGQIVPVSSSDVDFTCAEKLRAFLAEVSADVIVNSAAYTSVDKAEVDVEQARLVNAVAPAILSEEAKNNGSILIHYSTDYVFDGKSNQPYTESSPTAPLNVYGKTKLAGDEAILRSGCKHLIFRTSWVYSTRGNNFLRTMLRLAEEKNSLSVVSDQIGAPTSASVIAQATATVLAQITAPNAALEVASGIYNLTAAGACSWFDFAKEIFEQSHMLWGTKKPSLESILTRNYPRPALRPENSCLSGKKINQVFGIQMPGWEASLRKVLEGMEQADNMAKGKLKRA